jgi:hypothetical protein
MDRKSRIRCARSIAFHNWISAILRIQLIRWRIQSAIAVIRNKKPRHKAGVHVIGSGGVICDVPALPMRLRLR